MNIEQELMNDPRVQQVMVEHLLGLLPSLEFGLGSLTRPAAEVLKALGYDDPEQIYAARENMPHWINCDCDDCGTEDELDFLPDYKEYIPYAWMADYKWENIGGLEAQRLACINIEFESYYFEERIGSIH